jgi:CheY-like chemotaxis protein
VRTKHALVLDDDKRWFSVCGLMCELFGYDCTWAPDLETGRALLKSKSYDVLILDLGFPDGQGDLFPPDVDPLDLLLAGLIATSSMPVLVCTGSPDRTKVALVREQLKASRQPAELHHKTDSYKELCERFRFVAGSAPDTAAPKPMGLAGVLLAFFSLLVLHFSLLSSFFLAARYLPKDSVAGLMYFVMALIAFTGSVATVLLFWGVKAVTGSDASQLLRVAITSFSAWSRPSASRVGPGGARASSRRTKQ